MGNLDKMCEEVYRVLQNNQKYADVYEDSLLPGGAVRYLCVDIHMGDWKHEHLFIKHLINENFSNLEYVTSIEEPSDEDCYSARHFYMVKG